ncbi:MAG: PspC domain-containing protein [Clostridia bacterium]|nr:PspC domain-containing protein [Clostridia bacterium]
MVCGVCGGIAEYFGIDPTIIRFIWVVFCLAGGSGVLLYIIMALIMPDPYRPDNNDDNNDIIN